MWKSASSWKFRCVSLLHPLSWGSIRSRIWMREDEERWERGDHLTIWHGDKWGPGAHLDQDINRAECGQNTESRAELSSTMQGPLGVWLTVPLAQNAEERPVITRGESQWLTPGLDGVMRGWSEITSSQYPDQGSTQLWVPSSQHYRLSRLSEGLMLVSRWSQDRSLLRSESLAPSGQLITHVTCDHLMTQESSAHRQMSDPAPTIMTSDR